MLATIKIADALFMQLNSQQISIQNCLLGQYLIFFEKYLARFLGIF